MTAAISSVTSDYRGLQNSVPMDTASSNNHTDPSKSYSYVLNQQQAPKFPSKNQAILFTTVEGVQLQEYVIALGNIVQPKNILFSSRISNNRICVYLSSEETLDKFMDEHGSIKINNQDVLARRLITPAVRLVMSNVCPTIPHSKLEQELQLLGLKLMSPTTFLRINIANPEYAHVLSFRRQVYITPSDKTIPESLLINFDNTTYRIFLSQDMTCYKCKQSGHIASQCNTTSDNQDTENISQTITSQISNPDPEKDEAPSVQNPVSANKRNISEVLISPTVEREAPDNKYPTDNFRKPESTNLKKYKPSTTKETSTPIEELMLPTKKFIEEELPSPVLSYEELKDFLENVHGSSDPLSVAKQYTADIYGLINMMTLVYPHFTERSIKTRCTRIKKKLMRQIKHDEIPKNVALSDTDSEASSQDLF